MKKLKSSLFVISLLISTQGLSDEWKNECVGYYNLQLPDNVEVALYPVEDLIKPREEPVRDGDIMISRFADTGITFNKTYNRSDKEAVQAQFSQFYYSGYELDVSTSSSDTIDFIAYRARQLESKEFINQVKKQYGFWNYKHYGTPLTPESEFNLKYGYLMRAYPKAFTIYSKNWYAIYINKDNRLYHFWSFIRTDSGEISQPVDKDVRKSEPEVLSVLNRFRSRNLYEVPADQGFCIPYGFIAADSGSEKRNMGVTYRLKDHPDISIFFQDFGPNPGPGKRRPDQKMSAKEYVTYFWNMRYGHTFREIKLYGKGFSYPKIDNRNGVAAFAKFTRMNKDVDYGYMAFVKGDAATNEPDLLFYVMRDTKQANGKPPMDKDELEKLAEHIVKSIKHR